MAIAIPLAEQSSRGVSVEWFHFINFTQLITLVWHRVFQKTLESLYVHASHFLFHFWV